MPIFAFTTMAGLVMVVGVFSATTRIGVFGPSLYAKVENSKSLQYDTAEDVYPLLILIQGPERRQICTALCTVHNMDWPLAGSAE
jgi:hypothetical protein